MICASEALSTLGEASPEPVILHVYDLSASARTLNRVLLRLGTGMYHCGVEVYGVEWAYSGTKDPISGSGIFRCVPGCCGDFPYCGSVDMGKTTMLQSDFHKVLMVMKQIWPSEGYDFLKKNCCHFSDHLCRMLGVGGIPPWVRNMGDTAAAYSQSINSLAKGAKSAFTVAGKAAKPPKRVKMSL
jgi:hypothetical protein